MQASVTTGERVRLLRTARGLDQGELATKAGVSTTTVSNLETGLYGGRRATLVALAAALEASPEALDSDHALVEQLAAWFGVQPGTPPPPRRDPVAEEALELLRQLGPDRAKAALGLLRSLLTLQGEPPKSGKG